MQEDQTEYSDHPLFETDISYGVMYSYEDMATIAQMMFSKDGWDSLLNRAQQNKTN